MGRELQTNHEVMMVNSSDSFVYMGDSDLKNSSDRSFHFAWTFFVTFVDQFDS